MIRIDSTAYLFLFVLAAVWGGSFSLIKVALEEFSPLAIATFRTGIGALTIIPILAATKPDLSTLTRVHISKIVLMAVLGYLAPFFLISWAETHVASSTAAMLLATGPIAAFAIGWTIGIEDLNRFKGLGIALGLLGVALIYIEETRTIDSTSSLLGLAAVLLATIFYVIGGFLARSLSEISSPLLTTITLLTAFLAGAIIMSSISAPVGPTPATPNASALLAIVALGTVSTGGAFLLRFVLIKRAGYVFASTVGYLIPLFGLLFGHLFLDENIGHRHIVAISLVLLGVTLFRTSHGISIRFPNVFTFPAAKSKNDPP